MSFRCRVAEPRDEAFVDLVLREKKREREREQQRKQRNWRERERERERVSKREKLGSASVYGCACKRMRKRASD